MGIEDIFRALEEQAERDSTEVLNEAKAHAAVILEEAEVEATKAREHRVMEAERVARLRSSQELNTSRLEARKRLAAVKERAVTQVFDEAAGKLAEVRSRADYEAAFRALADEALAGLRGDYRILVDPADVDLARTVVAEKGLTAEIAGDISTAGGIVIEMEGGRVMRRNTLEDRLDKLRGLAQADVAEILFT